MSITYTVIGNQPKLFYSHSGVFSFELLLKYKITLNLCNQFKKLI